MSRPVISPLTVGATVPESLSMLQRRLQKAEEQTEELRRSLGSLGASADQLLMNSSNSKPRPVSPVNIHGALSATAEGLLWRQSETLVARMCRLESVLHTLKLTIFRLEMNRELNPSHTALLSELQEQHEEEQRSSHRDLLHVQDELTRACEERQEAQREVLRLREALENTNSTKVEVLQGDCQILRTDGQANRAELKKREEQIMYLERECQQLRDHSRVKETLISQLSKEIKSVKTALQKQQQDNSRLFRDGQDLRAAADQVQVLNDKLEVQCSELSTALHSLTLENTRLQTEYQNNVKVERDRVSKHLKEQDLLLETARRNIQAELQGAISEKLILQKELEALKTDHSELQQSSTVSQVTAVSHQQMLERTIQRLRGELSCAGREGETLREERDRMKSQMNSAIFSLKKEKNILETQLSEIKAELTTRNSALQKQKEENQELMESLAVMQHQQVNHRQVEQMLWDLTDSKNKLAYEKGKSQARVQQMAAELKALKADCNEHCQANTKLQYSYSQMQIENQTLKEQLGALLQQHRDTNEIAQTLENVLSSHARLQQNTQTLQAELREKAQELHTLRRESREAELKEARTEIGRLTECVDSLKNRLNRETDSRRKLAQRLKKALNDASAKSGDLSQANQKLQEKVSELEKLVSQLNQSLHNRTVLSHSLRIKDLEAEIESLEEAKDEYKKRSYEQSQCLLQMRSEMESLQSELQYLSSTQQGELQAQRALNHSLQEQCQHLEESSKRFRDERDEAELRLREVCLESQQITENMVEDHRALRVSSESFNCEDEPQKHRESLWRTGKGGTLSTPAQTHVCFYDPKLEPWASALQRWQMKKELGSIAGSYKHTRHVRSLTR
ncbi:coiled-coil domain-containing protein 150 isoform X1 [Pimephales promelas]|uniref:coiled-coil domain-containing protein 150 isoform X1 n=1 Tax=Pimephales promelas TaxID=90988 RepID=UPI0019558379|nr:coiled-coil domain-containing protein 150 isoform X1 [Pimephales promelas]